MTHDTVTASSAAPTPPALPSLTELSQRAVARAWPALPAAVAAGAALLFALKTLRVARGDPTVALAVAQASDKTAVFAGLLVQAVPLLVLLAWAAGCLVAFRAGAALLAAADRRDPTAGRAAVVRLAAAGGSLGVTGWLALAVTPWPALVGCAVLAAGAAWHGRRARRAAQRPPWEPPQFLVRTPLRAAVALAGFAFAGVLMLADNALTGVLSDDMWLPAHQIVTADGKTVVGYVLSRGDGTVTILRDGDRGLVLLPADRIVADRVCAPPFRGDRRSAWDALRHRAAPRVDSCAARP